MTNKLVQQNRVNKIKFDTTKSCDDTLKQQLLAEFQNNYVDGVSNENVGFEQNTTLEKLNNIYD